VKPRFTSEGIVYPNLDDDDASQLEESLMSLTGPERGSRMSATRSALGAGPDAMCSVWDLPSLTE